MPFSSLTHQCHECGNPTLAKCDFCGHRCGECRKCKNLKADDNSDDSDHLFKIGFHFSMKKPKIFQRSNSIKSTQTRRNSSCSIKRRLSLGGFGQRTPRISAVASDKSLDSRSSTWVDTKSSDITDITGASADRSSTRETGRSKTGHSSSRSAVKTPSRTESKVSSRPPSRSGSRHASRQASEITGKTTDRSSSRPPSRRHARTSTTREAAVAGTPSSMYSQSGLHGGTRKRTSTADPVNSQQRQQQQQQGQQAAQALYTVWGQETATPARAAQREESKQYTYNSFSQFF